MRRTLSPYPVPETEYFERVLRHDPNSLTQLDRGHQRQPPARPRLAAQGLSLYAPWALLDAAWVSLARGRDGRPAAASQDLYQILDLFLALDDPVTRKPEGMKRGEGYLQRATHHQGPWQEDAYAQLSRSIALLDQTPYPDDADDPLEVILPGWDHDLLGCSLADYLGIVHLVWGCATAHPNPRRRGRFALDWYPVADYDQFDRLRSSTQVKAVLNRHFVTTKNRLRAAFPAGHDPLLRRYTHNPLRSSPLVGGVPGGYLVPVPAAVLGKGTPLGLYYTGGDNRSEWGKAFTNDVGRLFERAAERAAQLAAVDPDWDCPWPLDWQRHYRVLADLVDADGVLPEIQPGVLMDGDDIGRWLERQKQPGTWAQLSTEQQERLSQLGVQPLEAPSPAPSAKRTARARARRNRRSSAA